jgi:preprotein translocase subunit SecA
VRAVGGLYVLGSERHESRRIDNQLRGRSGRQGDPGESRFFLSLEDELMRLFATGAMSWVMDRALADDVPIEARMVTRAIERAQNTVEQKNAEVRKDVLKYDEVMNEQRKVIYERRMQLIDGEDLSNPTVELIEEKITKVVADCCPSNFAEEWDLESLLTEINQYYPSNFTVDDLALADGLEQLTESVVADAVEYYEARTDTFGGDDTARDLERQVMLSIIDQRWRQHLLEMDYLREGIHLRGIAQTDPLVAWQREGFQMFGHLMEAIDDDYVRFINHVQLVNEQEAPPDYSQASYASAEEPVQELGGTGPTLSSQPGIGASPNGQPLAAAPGAVATAAPAAAGLGQPNGRAAAPSQTKQKVGRNEPCPCGSGKKFKLCHGAN